MARTQEEWQEILAGPVKGAEPAIAEASAEELELVQSLEAEGKERAGIEKAVAARLAELTAEEDDQGEGAGEDGAAEDAGADPGPEATISALPKDSADAVRARIPDDHDYVDLDGNGQPRAKIDGVEILGHRKVEDGAQHYIKVVFQTNDRGGAIRYAYFDPKTHKPLRQLV